MSDDIKFTLFICFIVLFAGMTLGISIGHHVATTQMEDIAIKYHYADYVVENKKAVFKWNCEINKNK